VTPKEVNKEQPSYINLSATATRVLQCQCWAKLLLKVTIISYR
jgi:hypothetical protein